MPTIKKAITIVTGVGAIVHADVVWPLVLYKLLTLL